MLSRNSEAIIFFERKRNNSNTDNPEYSSWILKLADGNNSCNEPWDREILKTIN